MDIWEQQQIRLDYEEECARLYKIAKQQVKEEILKYVPNNHYTVHIKYHKHTKSFDFSQGLSGFEATIVGNREGFFYSFPLSEISKRYLKDTVKHALEEIYANKIK